MATDSLTQAVEILTLINTIEPAAIGLVKVFLSGIAGKTRDEILAQSNDIWQQVIDTARAEIPPPIG